MSTQKHSFAVSGLYSKVFAISALFFALNTTLSFGQYRHRGALQQSAVLADGQNPFWNSAITNGQRSNNTQTLSVLEYNYNQFLTEGKFLKMGASVFMDYGQDLELTPRLGNYFVQWDSKPVSIAVGARQREERFLGLSSTNGDILWSNNARPLPGIEFFMNKPYMVTPWFGIKGSFAHFWMPDDRVVQGTTVHHKSLDFKFRFSDNSSLQIGAQHYAQMGGTEGDNNNYRNRLSDYFNVLIVKNGEGTVIEDYSQHIGNHLGSYRVTYSQKIGPLTGDFYFQSIFEDASGRELSNFPDGLWGAFFKLPKRSFVDGFLYEFVQTNWQSGVQPQRGNDNYFNSSIYPSGWTYFGRTIGLPFLTPNTDGIGIANNSVKAHHFGATASSNGWHVKVLSSYVLNEGTFSNPLPGDNTVWYLYLGGEYELTDHLNLHVNLSGDYARLNDNRSAFLAGITYKIAKRHRFYTGYLDFEPEFD